MKTSQKGIDLICLFEGLRLEAYQDAVGIWTIGYGSTRGVSPGLKISKEEALRRLKQDLTEAETKVKSLVQVSLNENEFSALVSFVYNLGAGNLQYSTLLKKLNHGDRKGAADEMLRWNRAGGRPLAGLTRRRQAERELFLLEPELPRAA